MVVFEGGIGYNGGDIAFLTPFVGRYTFGYNQTPTDFLQRF